MCVCVCVCERERESSFLFERKITSHAELEPTIHTAYEADALPTELLKQLSWPGQIKARDIRLTSLTNRQTQTQH